LRPHHTISPNTRIITLLNSSFLTCSCQIPPKKTVFNIYFVVATHDVPSLVGLLLREDSAFTMASPFIVVPTQPHVRPILNVTTLYDLILPLTNPGILAAMMQLVVPVLPTLGSFLLSIMIQLMWKRMLKKTLPLKTHVIVCVRTVVITITITRGCRGCYGCLCINWRSL
jgi:hypothetical protein